MLLRICCALWLLACAPAWCQVVTAHSEAGSGANATNATNATNEMETPLQVPPPVSAQAYPSTFLGETESNYLSGGMTLTSAYSNNIGYGGGAVSDMSYSIFPTIALDKTTYRMHLFLDYAPGFTFYQHYGSLNQNNQNVTMNLQYRLSPNLTATVLEQFLKTSNIFDQANPLLANPVSGSAPVSNVAIIAPATELMSNNTAAQFTYQVSADGMIGGGGNYNTLSYPNMGEQSGLSNSRTAGGSFFYSKRFNERNYLGASYQYQNYLSFQSAFPSTETQTQTAFLFLTMYLKPHLSVSVSAGPQYYTSTQGLLNSATGWAPMTMVSANWQGERTAVSASYSRLVSGGGGLNGTFNSNNGSLGFSWRTSRNWTSGLSGGYTDYQNLTPLFLQSSPGGHTWSGTVSVQRTLRDHANLQFGYSFAHQSYAGIPALSANPNINRVFVTLNFTFSRPLQK